MPRSDPRAAPLLAARSALDAKDPPSALRHLSQPTPPVDDFRALLRARAHVLEGKPERALEALATVKPRALACDEEPILQVHVQALAAELLAPRDPKAAADRLLLLPPSGPILAQAITLLDRAEDPRAREVETRLLVEAAETLEARQLAEKLGPKGVAERLGTIERRMERVRNLLERHRNEEAQEEARRLLKELGAEHALACELGYVEGKSLRKQRRYRNAIEALVDARARCEKKGNVGLSRRSALLEAQVRAIRGQSKGTKQIADWFVAKHKEHSYADDALLLHAKLLEGQGKASAAAKVYQRMIDELPDGDQTPEAAWQLALQAIEKKKNERAEELLAWIVARRELRPIDRARARYWRARLMEGGEGKKGAAGLYRELVKQPSFYAWLALDGLRERDPALAKSLREDLVKTIASRSETVTLPESLLAKPEIQRARVLFAADEPELARAELQRLACGDLSPDEALALAVMFDRIGAYPDAQLLLRARAETFLAKPLEAADIPILRLAYSRPYLDLVEAAAGAEKLETLFLLALVREESTFDPEIVSWAGATGLAQLMPATAIGAYATVYKKRLTELERLVDPELNLRLGAHVLKAGLVRWGGTEALALSAYNGGNGLTKRILPERKLPFDRWVETIPVKETRGYVKRVIETWGIYRLLYDEKQPFIDLPDEISPPSD